MIRVHTPEFNKEHCQLKMIYSLLNLILWLVQSLLVYFLLVVALTVACRAYKIVYARRNKRPVDGSQAVLVTGATSGIGLAVSKHLYRCGYSLIVGYYNSSEAGYGELMQIRDKSNSSSSTNNGNKQQQMIFVELDVRKQQSIEDAFEKCTKALEKNNMLLYALINNAGLGSLQPFAWLQRTNIKNLIETNLLGSLLVTREFLPLLVKSKGRIVNVSSGLGLVPGSNYTTYGITKSAQIYFTRSMNQESQELNYGIRSIAVIPHNFIKNTNICSHNVKTNESAWSELRPIERQLYKQQYDKHLSLASALEEATKLHAKLANEQQKSTSISSGSSYNNRSNSESTTTSKTRDDVKGRRPLKTTTTTSAGISGSSGKEIAKMSGRLLSIPSCLLDVIERLKGGNVALTLEQSGALECFEDALRLADPPEHIFAGDNIYNLLIGSLLLSLPASCINLLARSVSPSLYR